MRLNSVDNTNYIKCTDDASILEVFCTDYNGKPVDMTSFKKVEVIVGNEHGRLATLTPLTKNSTGYVTFKFSKSNLLPSGRYFLELHLTLNDGTEQKKIAPSKSSFVLIVTDSIDEITSNKVNIIDLNALLQMVETSRNYAVTSANYSEKIYTIYEQSTPVRVSSDAVPTLQYYNKTTSTWSYAYGKLPSVLDMGTF